MEILLVVGSESGNAEMVGDVVKDTLEGRGHGVETFRGGSLESARLPERDVVLIVCSSTGIGDLPQNIEPFFHELSGTRPRLAGLRYGVIGLGDRNYKESFLGGPRKWDALLTELGATRVGDRLELDATDNPAPDQDAAEWVVPWVEGL
jgi:MioC protein